MTIRARGKAQTRTFFAFFAFSCPTALTLARPKPNSALSGRLYVRAQRAFKGSSALDWT